MSIRNLIIQKRIENNKEFYNKLRTFEESITDEEANEIILKVNPDKTKLIKIQSEEEFLEVLTEEKYEVVSAIAYPAIAVNACTNSLDKIFFIRGEEFVEQIGEICTEVNGDVVTRKPIIKENGQYIIVKRRTKEDSIFGKYYYEVIVYIP